MGDLEVIGPDNADVTGEIVVKNNGEPMLQKLKRKERGFLSIKTLSGILRTPRKTGIKVGAGKVEYVITENTADTFLPGSYALASQLSCEQDIEP